jgi:TolB-like protein/Tfp pilus assembly protein PilF
MSFSSGDRLGSYEITDRLGAGGMGQVYRAKDLKLGRDVAVKVLREELAADPERLRRFEQEARSASALNHPNIITIHDIGKHEDTPYIAMELVEGKTLKEMLSGGPLPIKELFELATQIVEGLAKAHSGGIIHRDLKPANLMVTEDGFVKILDFGLAKLLSSPSGADSELETLPMEGTAAGAVMGTVGYMSPEQARGLTANFRTDQFSLGSILYEMATGKRAFLRDSSVQTLSAIIEDEPEPPTRINRQTPSDLQSIIQRCLTKDPGGRYASTRDLAKGLREAAERFSKMPPSSVEEQPSIAVLPFANMSADPEQEYFCDGMAEEIINAMAQVKGLRVLARMSAFSFKGKNLDVREMGKKLGVETVLEGSVRKAGQRLRITAQLVNVADGYHIWSQRFDRDAEDIFAIQDDISLAIVDRLKVELLSDERDAVAKKPTENIEAYNLYLKGIHFTHRYAEEGFKKGIEHFEKALRLDPGYASAYAGMAHCYKELSFLSYLSAGEGYPKAKEAVKKALEIDDSLGEAHATMGSIKFICDWDMDSPEIDFQRALALSPGSVEVHFMYAYYLFLCGKFENATTIAKRATELDPLSAFANAWLGFSYYYANRYDESIEQHKHVLDLDPNFIWSLIYLSYNYTMKGMHSEAIPFLERAISVWPTDDDPILLSNGGWVYAKAGQEEKARELLERLLELSHKSTFDPSGVAQVYSALAQHDEAFEWLERGYEVRSGIMIFLKAYAGTFFKDLSSDPRYQALLKKVGFCLD